MTSGPKIPNLTQTVEHKNGLVGLDDHRNVDCIYADIPFNTGEVQRSATRSYSDAHPDFYGWLYELLELSRVALADTGNVLIHCDWRETHNVRRALDEVFGAARHVNELIWKYNAGGASKTRFSRKHDTIHWYSKTASYYSDIPREPYPNDYGDRPGFHPEGRIATDVWDIPRISNTSHERVDYPNQKPLALLERIVTTFTPPGGTIVDPCCGSGTTLVAAKLHHRNAYGYDVNSDAVKITGDRLAETNPNPTQPALF